jgi:flagellar biosynthetic protein FliR
MGLGMAQTIDPNATQVPVISSFLVVLSTLVFLSIGGHLILITIILESFAVLPINGEIIFQDTIWGFVEWTAMVFLGAVLVALPIVLIMLLVNLCIGIVTRAAPALNIFAVGFPAMVLIGLLLLIAFMVNISQRIQWLWMRAFESAQAIWVL